ncbi:MAG: glycosyltransferase family 4 protein [Bacteroidia bacterium]|nr:glycosyltransferase family 4 protein [Bacteroidia bacterium]
MARGVLLTGPGSYTSMLEQALRSSDRLQAVIDYYPEWSMRLKEGAPKRIRAYRWGVQGMWALWRRIPRWGKQENPRTWHFSLYDILAMWHLPKTDFLWAWSGTSLYTLRKAQRLGVPTFLEFPTVHPQIWDKVAQSEYSYFPRNAGRFAIWPQSLLRRIEAEIAIADHIQVLSSFVLEGMVGEGVPREKIHVLPLGIEIDRFFPSSHKDKNIFRLLYVGRIDPLKGIRYLLEAWVQLRLPYAELWLVGPVVDEMKPILAQYEGSFRYMGSYERSQLPEIYRKANAFVFPTLMDSFGLVLLEAMASGLPVVATTHSAAPDIITEGKEGFLIPPGEIQSIMNAIETLYRRPEQAQEMACAARRRVEEAYTFDHYVNRVQSHLERYGL